MIPLPLDVALALLDDRTPIPILEANIHLGGILIKG
jgi:hypothetical protein